MAKDAVKAIQLTFYDVASAGATYDVINTNGLDEACTQIQLINDSNLDVLISLDGVTDNFYLAAGSQFSLPVQANSQPQGYRQMFPKGMKFYLESFTGAAGIGYVFLSGIYTDPN